MINIIQPIIEFIASIMDYIRNERLIGLGRKESEHANLLEENRILKEQRDNDINSVADADKLWSQYKDKK